MYIPPYFKNEDLEDVAQLIHENGFGTLVSTVEGRPWATHIPMMLVVNRMGKQVIVGHTARGNQQLRSYDPEQEFLTIFHGPHAYVSSSWYDHENVPTWNYKVVHIYGHLRILQGDELLQSLKRLVDKYERNAAEPVSVETMSQEFVKKEMRGIIGFELSIDEIQAASKLSQNRDKKNKANIISHLQGFEDSGANSVAQEMIKLDNK